jgi:hypothetical protein
MRAKQVFWHVFSDAIALFVPPGGLSGGNFICIVAGNFTPPMEEYRKNHLY